MGIVDWEPRALPSEARCRVWADNSGVFLASDPTGGVKLMPSPGDAREYAFAECFATEGVRVRPWKNCEPVPWPEFFAATHPPIPEGWEAVGEWANPLTLKDGADAVLLEDGNIAHSLGRAAQGSGSQSSRYAGWGVCLRRALPAIPEGWEARSEWVARGTHVPAATGPEDCVLLEDGRVVPWIPNDYAGTFRAVRKVPPPADWGDVPKGVELRPAHGPGGPSNGVFLNGVYVGRVFDVVDAGHYAHSAAQPPVEGSPFASLPAAIVALTGRRE